MAFVRLSRQGENGAVGRDRTGDERANGRSDRVCHRSESGQRLSVDRDAGESGWRADPAQLDDPISGGPATPGVQAYTVAVDAAARTAR
jgi:hypothetical protein